ncbi:Sodium/glucose cotransporter 1 [Hondaea fermentalgiana]|uniref:Sodium/glucose cotransporter 1 n=1 Tax=Hondaea fermentalgiana TaxID=2315210 RepID=A0A2R5G6C7_9STRA|nr:Sodium/glucose cotransporter 1 [Hondaea fermentalgiana]|eukprot:GBG26607.1 Sodium/glucose cotransporter 1 [Hondaea fermentalgiana]
MADAVANEDALGKASIANAMGVGDWVTLILYYVVVIIIFAWVSFRSGKQTSAGYFLADRSVRFTAVGFSLFASNIGSEHFVGLAGGAASSGVATAFYEIGAVICVLALGMFFLPTYLSAAIETTPDYLERRYNLKCKTIMVAVSLAVYVLSRISATLFAGQLILVELLDVNKTVAVVLLIAFTTLYTVVGGLEAVIYTEVLQTIVLVAGGFIMLAYSLGAVGGWSGLVDSVNALDDVDPRFMHLFRPSSDPTMPWTGFIFGFYTFAPWYFGVDQVIVQRTLAAKNVAHGQVGCLFAATLKFIPFFIMVVPGLCARVLVEERLTPAELEKFNYDSSYPWLVLNVVPKNMRGLIIASMLSALMSALASVFNSSGTLFALTVWRQWYPEATEERLVLVGRITIIVLALLALAWLPVMPYLGSSLFTIINKPQAYLGPPLLCVYIWGMVSRIPTRRAGEITLKAGVSVGAVRLVLEVIEDVAGDKMFGIFTMSNFLHYAAVSFWVCTFLLFGLSHFLRVSSQDGQVEDSFESQDADCQEQQQQQQQQQQQDDEDGGNSWAIRDAPRRENNHEGSGLDGSTNSAHEGNNDSDYDSLFFSWKLFDKLMAREASTSYQCLDDSSLSPHFLDACLLRKRVIQGLAVLIFACWVTQVSIFA